MSEQEEVDLYVAPFVEPDEQVEAALEMVIESWKDEYTRAKATLQSESSRFLNTPKQSDAGDLLFTAVLTISSDPRIDC